MKFQIKLTYAGQDRFFDVDYDDETCSDEAYQDGIDINNFMITEDFLGSYQLNILREGDPEWTSQ